MAETENACGYSDVAYVYEFRVRGVIDERWSACFDGLTVCSGRENETRFIGEIADPAMLYGVVRRFRDAGMTLVAMRQIASTGTDRSRITQSPKKDEGGVMEQDRSILRWGGISGVVGIACLVLAVPAALLGVGPDPVGLEEWVTRFPSIKSARVVENGLYLLGLILQVPLFLAVHRAFRERNPASALFGPAIAIVGIVIMATVAAPHGAHAPLSALAQDPGIAPTDLRTVALMWQALWGVFYGVLNVGFVVVPLGIGVCGIAASRSKDYGRRAGYAVIALGTIAFLAGFAQFADPGSDVGFVTYLACLISYGLLSAVALKTSQKRRLRESVSQEL